MQWDKIKQEKRTGSGGGVGVEGKVTTENRLIMRDLTEMSRAKFGATYKRALEACHARSRFGKRSVWPDGVRDKEAKDGVGDVKGPEQTPYRVYISS